MSNFYGSFFTLIFAVLLVGTILYRTRVLDYLLFKVQLPTSDSTDITDGGPKITLEGPVPVDP